MNQAHAFPNDERAHLARRRWDELKSDRARHEGDWEAIARLIRPQRGGFSMDNPNDRTLEKPLSSAPIMAQINFASGLYGALTNPTDRWFRFETVDDDLNAWKPMAEWLDTVTTRVFASFAPAVSPFYSQATMIFSDIAAFGNGAQYDEVAAGERKILDVTLSLAEAVWDIDGFGRVCEVVRRFYLTPRAAIDMFGAEALPPKILEYAEAHSTDKHAYFHHVGKNAMFEPGRIGARGKRWFSRYACEVGDHLIRESGYDEMPFFAPRWEVESGAIYGTGPGFNALASARTHHRMDEATLRAAQRAADPTILAPDRYSWPLNGTIRPGQVVYGGVNQRGDMMLRSLEGPRDIGLTLQEKQAKIEEIRDAFHYTLMNLAGRTGMTATEVMTINEERMRLWAPHMGRVQEEYLAPKIARRFSLLWKQRQLPPPPEGADGVALQVQYTSAAAMAQRSAQGAAAVRVIEDIAPLASLDPRYMDRIDPDGLFEVLMQARGAPARMMRSRDDADAIAQARASAEQQAQQMQMLQQGAGAARDMAGAMGGMAGAMGGPEGGGM
jgi:hypothetical protein